MSTSLPRRPRSLSSRSKICIVRSTYNEKFTQALVDNCVEELKVILPNVEIHMFETPGGFEVPVTVEHAFETINPDLVIAFGLIIRGETMHGDIIASSITNALQEISVRRIKPVIHQVLLVNNEEQAYARCIGSDLNRGKEAARAACAMAQTMKEPATPVSTKKALF